MTEIPDEMVRKAAEAIADGIYEDDRSEVISRAALGAAGVAEMISAFDGLAEQCQMLRRDLAEAQSNEKSLAQAIITKCEKEMAYRATTRTRLDALRAEMVAHKESVMNICQWSATEKNTAWNTGVELINYLDAAIRDLCGEEGK